MKKQDEISLIGDASVEDITVNIKGVYQIFSDSTDLSNLPQSTKVISIRGTKFDKITVPYNYSLEKKRRKNLLANVGEEPSGPSSDLFD